MEWTDKVVDSAEHQILQMRTANSSNHWWDVAVNGRGGVVFFFLCVLFSPA